MKGMILMSKHVAYGVVLLVSLCVAIAGPVYAAQTVVTLTSQQMTVHEVQGDLGDYYTLSVALPELHGRELLGAYLEFYVDADAIEVEGRANDAPSLDVFALAQAHQGAVSEAEFGAPALAPGLVMSGESRRVVRDITGIVRGWFADPQSNHGLILGSLTGERDGVFTVKSGVLGDGVVARLIVHHRDG